jgi:hypothetical protein
MKNAIKFIKSAALIFVLAGFCGMALAETKLPAGQLNVIFKEGTEQDKAQETIGKYGLSVERSSTGRKWRKRHHMIVSVPKGEEARWQQTLSEDETIESVTTYDTSILSSIPDEE